MTYLKDNSTGKVYSEDVMAAVVAIDPTSFATDLQNLTDKVAALQAQIDDINNTQIPAVKASSTDFFTQFPELLPAGQNADGTLQ